MADLLNDIEWGEPVVQPLPDADWEAQVKASLGSVPGYLLRVSPVPWLRETLRDWDRIPVVETPQRLMDIAKLVTAQENACRYCYGATRATMRFFGYPEKLIMQIERDVQLADLDQADRAFVRFCRNLARSKPRPARAERDPLVELGYSPRAVAEFAFVTAASCFYNRAATFMALPPEYGFEKMSGNLLGRLLRPIIARKLRSVPPLTVEQPAAPPAEFGGVVAALADLPAGAVLAHTLADAFASPVLSQDLKMLMFAVVARQLDCRFCQAETHNRLQGMGYASDEVDACLATLTSPRLTRQEVAILNWTRETVHFETGAIQKQTRALAEQVRNEELLEAIGVAALANSVVRLAMLLE